ncbi:MAG: ABC transporter permease [Pseudomonadota bacterium]
MTQLDLLRKDISDSLKRWEFWFYLGWNDIAKQYRRSFVGPIWITLNSALFIVAFGLVGAQLFKHPLEEYLPYFCTGQIIFVFFSNLLNEGCNVYTGAAAFLKQTPYPKMAFVFRVVWRSLILLAHNFIVILIVLLWSGHIVEVNWPMFLIALIVTVVSGLFAVAIMGALATRFRDIPLIVSSVMQIAFFVTPVMWRPDQLTERAQLLVIWNPLAAYLDILRQPLLGGVASGSSWLMVFGMLTMMSVGFVFLYQVVRRRIVYWL